MVGAVVRAVVGAVVRAVVGAVVGAVLGAVTCGARDPGSVPGVSKGFFSLIGYKLAEQK